MKTMWTIIVALCLYMMPVLAKVYEKPIVVVVPSYNNAEWYGKNLSSIFMQKYQNYRIIYIDDCSSDGTYELVSAYVQQCGQQERVIVIGNTERYGALANHYKAVHQCDDRAIVVQLDGDDWFAHDNVLSVINEAYADENVWMTYGQFEVYPSGKRGQCKLMPSSIITMCAYREYEWITSAPRTFYAGLFKKIKLQHLIDNGKFYRTASDLACMFPMLEMANGRLRFIDEILYVYNCKTTNNDYKKNLQLQRYHENRIRGGKKYRPINDYKSGATSQLDVQLALHDSNMLDQTSHGESDDSYTSGKTSDGECYDVGIILFSDNNPVGLPKLLSELPKSFVHGGTVTIMYQAADEHIACEYEVVLREYEVALKQYRVQDVTSDFKNKLIALLNQLEHKYLLLMRDTFNITSLPLIDLTLCSHMMRMTHAHSFFLGLNRTQLNAQYLSRPLRLPSMVEFENGVCAWQFKDGEYEWAAANCLAAALYSKTMFMRTVTDLCFDSIDELESAWCRYPVDLCAVGLCFAQ